MTIVMTRTGDERTEFIVPLGRTRRIREDIEYGT
jgi:hypothetical protein